MWSERRADGVLGAISKKNSSSWRVLRLICIDEGAVRGARSSWEM